MNNLRWSLLAVFVTALVTLSTELLLIRVFDVIMLREIAYVIITCAMLAFGAAGVYLTLRPGPSNPRDVRHAISLHALAAALSLLLILPAINLSGLDLATVMERPLTTLLQLFLIYSVLVLPFFFLGIVVVKIIMTWSRRIHQIYFSDLLGAGIGCIVFLPFLPRLGPGGLLMIGAGLMLLVAAMFAGRRLARAAFVVGALAALVTPALLAPGTLEFAMLVDKRDVSADVAAGRREVAVWDVIAKIDVLDAGYRQADGKPCCWKHVAYDGGNQSTRLFRLEEGTAALRRALDAGTEPVRNHFWFGGVVAAHYLKRDRGQDVLVIGSGGGQEVTAALTYGAGHVDAVEMVGTVIDLVRDRYADYIGNVFNDPRVTLIHDDGRSVLRATDRKYDIIQIFSNFVSSAAAAGGSNSNSYFLQTSDAYKEYFTHLKADGILQVNVFNYPRVVTTAARAWAELGLTTDFQRHVAILERPYVNDPRSGRFQRMGDTLPTILIKMSPWTTQEIAELVRSQQAFEEPSLSVALVVNPLDPQASFLSRAFFSGTLAPELVARMPYEVRPATDDWAFFGFIRKPILSYRAMQPEPALFLNESTARFMNGQIERGRNVGLFKLVVPGLASVAFAILFIAVPMLLAPVGRVAWHGKGPAILYFACLGAGFIIVELIAIQVMARLIGFALYTYSTVIFTMLLAAGLGSMASGRLGITPARRWTWPFVGIALGGAVLLLLYPLVLHHALALPLPGRIAVASLLLLPASFCLGMPFPLGITAIRDLPAGAVAWAWGINGVFTVMGGVVSMLASLLVGFQLTLLGGLALYALAFLAFARLRRTMLPAVTAVRQPLVAGA